MNTLQPIESEMGLLGSIFLDNSVVDKVSNTLKPRDFVLPEHQRIFLTSMKLRAAGADICPLSVAEAYDGPISDLGGIEHLTKIDQAVGTARAYKFYSDDRIKPASMLRRLHQMLSEVRDEVSRSSLEEAAETLSQVSSKVFSMCAQGERSQFFSLGEATAEAMAQIKEAYHSDGGVSGVSSGFTGMDSQTTGFYPGDLLILAGRPGMGKTTLALNMATSVSMSGLPVVVFSLEMPATQLATKMLCADASIDLKLTKSGHLTTGQIERIVTSTSTVGELPMWIYDNSACTTADIQAICRQVQALAGQKIGMVVIDYIQLMRGERKRGQSREQEVSQISRELKIIARQIGAPVLALSQLNRGVEGRTDKRPQLSDLRESGAIEQDADAVFMVFRPGYYSDQEPQDLAEVIIAKQRRGPTGSFNLHFDGSRSVFTDWTEPDFKHFNGGYREH